MLRKNTQQMQSKRFDNTIAQKTNNRKPREEPDKRDIFCVVRDVFRITARKTSDVLGTAWAFMGAVSVIVIWGLTDTSFIIPIPRS